MPHFCSITTLCSRTLFILSGSDLSTKQLFQGRRVNFSVSLTKTKMGSTSEAEILKENTEILGKFVQLPFCTYKILHDSTKSSETKQTQTAILWLPLPNPVLELHFCPLQSGQGEFRPPSTVRITTSWNNYYDNMLPTPLLFLTQHSS